MINEKKLDKEIKELRPLYLGYRVMELWELITNGNECLQENIRSHLRLLEKLKKDLEGYHYKRKDRQLTKAKLLKRLQQEIKKWTKELEKLEEAKKS